MSHRLSLGRLSAAAKEILILTLLLLISPLSMATLIIGIYNNGTVYLASDSQMMARESNDTNATLRVRKVFPISDTYCVTIANNYGGHIEDPITIQRSILLFPTELAIMCSNAHSAKRPIQSRIASLVADFDVRYSEYIQKKVPKTRGGKDVATLLSFWGYDDSRKAFICYSYYFEETNQLPRESTFLVRGTNHIGGAIALEGEARFLPAVIGAKDGPLAQLKSAELGTFFEAIIAEVPIAESHMTNCIVQMFELQRKYAAAYSTDKGWVGEPYMIYRLTTNKFVRLR